MIIRDATDADRSAIAALHLANWQGAYAGVLPATFLADDLPGIFAARWASAELRHDVTLVADDGGLAGFVTVTMGGAEPFLYNLHVADGARGRGTGRRLMAAVAHRLIARGAASTYLHVLEPNTGARAFYARLGGVEGAAFDEALYGQPVRTVPVRWADLSVLASRASGDQPRV